MSIPEPSQPTVALPPLHESPSPLDGTTPSSLSEAAHSGLQALFRTSPSIRANPPQAFQHFVDQTREVNLLELAERHLGLPPKEGAIDRPQDDDELVILVIDHLAEELQSIGWGAQVMKGRPHIFTGTSWSPLGDLDLSVLLGEFAEKAGVPPLRARSHKFRKQLLKQFHCRLRAKPVEIPPGTVLVNFSNCTLVIDESGERIRPFRKEDLLTYTLPFPFESSASCPTFDRFLDRVLPDQASRDVLAEFFGWIFIRGLKLEVALLLYGQGSNGKSVVFDVVRALLGPDNVTTYGLSMLSKLENRSQLASSLLNYASEFKGRCDTDIFKKMVSGEPLEARRLFQDPHIMTDYARLAFNVNELPKDVEHTHGFFRRFLIVPFTQVIKDDEKDPNLARKIVASELPGVFNWVMRGMRRLRASKKFSDCPAAKEALLAYIAESDSVAMFIEEKGIVASDENRAAKDDLYEEYRKYCKACGMPALAKNAFGGRLAKRHGLREKKSGSKRYWLVESRGESSPEVL